MVAGAVALVSVIAWSAAYAAPKLTGGSDTAAPAATPLTAAAGKAPVVTGKGSTVTGEGPPPGTGPSAAPQPGEPGFHLPGVAQGKPPAFLMNSPPGNAFGKGKLVAGYPRGHFPLPNGTKVLSSEITSEGTTVRAFLEGTCNCTVDQVMATYDGSTSKLRMPGGRSPAVGGSVAKAYQDARNSVTVTADPEGRQTYFSVVLILTAAHR